VTKPKSGKRRLRAVAQCKKLKTVPLFHRPTICPIDWTRAKLRTWFTASTATSF
jgi:hypothetical protein